MSFAETLVIELNGFVTLPEVRIKNIQHCQATFKNVLSCTTLQLTWVDNIAGSILSSNRDDCMGVDTDALVVKCWQHVQP